jgi:long-subunit fatty acid transport protein
MKVLFTLVFLCSTGLSSAQDSKLGNWLIYFGNKEIKEKFNWHHEAQYRNYNALTDLEQLLLRMGLGYNLSDNNNNVLIGYAYILGQNYLPGTNDKVSTSEHRIYQQFITKQDINDRVKLQHRYRFEQRFIENNINLRFRYFLGLNIQINKKKNLYLSAYNEIFLKTKDNIFDRNRLYGGLGYKLNKTFRFEVGYMNQFLNNGSRDQINVITFMNF